MDYTTLSLAEVRAALEDVARDARATFGDLDGHELNWRSGPERWGIAQCFEHLMTSNRRMLQAARAALDVAHRKSLWERVPILPGIFGPQLVRSQAPESTRKHRTWSWAEPSASAIDDRIVAHFAEQEREVAASLEGLDEGRAARTIMTSPFVRFVTYSVLDGLRLMVAHDRRHFEQARRVMQSPGFPTRH